MMVTIKQSVQYFVQKQVPAGDGAAARAAGPVRGRARDLRGAGLLRPGEQARQVQRGRVLLQSRTLPPRHRLVLTQL